LRTLTKDLIMDRVAWNLRVLAVMVGMDAWKHVSVRCAVPGDRSMARVHSSLPLPLLIERAAVLPFLPAGHAGDVLATAAQRRAERAAPWRAESRASKKSWIGRLAADAGKRMDATKREAGGVSTLRAAALRTMPYLTQLSPNRSWLRKFAPLSGAVMDKVIHELWASGERADFEPVFKIESCYFEAYHCW